MMFKRLLFVLLLVFTPFVVACTSIALHWEGQMVSGRTFDWQDGRGFFVISPRGESRVALGLPAGDSPLHWQVKYGSVSIHMASGDKPNPAAVVDAMNEKGLSVAVLELSITKYPKVAKNVSVIGSAQLAEYIADRYATVAAVVKGLRQLAVVASIYHKFHVPLHYMLSDAAGHSAVVEYLNGHLHVVIDKLLPVSVLTNTRYRETVAMLPHYRAFGGELPSPGGYSTVARYVRAASYLERLPKAATLTAANAYLFDVLADSAEPLGAGDTPTQWSVVRDNTAGVYYFRTADNQHVREIHLSQINFNQHQKPSWLPLHTSRRGNATGDFSR